MTARAALRPSFVLAALLLVLGCEPQPRQEDPVAETLRMMQEGERTVRSGGGTSNNVLVKVERVRASAADAAGLAALWQYSDGKVTITGRDGLAAGGCRLGAAGAKFQAELSAWQLKARSVEKTSEEIVVQAGYDGVLTVSRSALVPTLRVFTPSGEVTVLQNVQLGCQLAVRPKLIEDGKVELELHPAFASADGKGYSLTALSTRVVVAPGQKMLLGASSNAAQDSAASGLFGYNERGERTSTVILVSAERL